MKFFKNIARKLTAVALAGTMAVGTAGAAMTPITASASSTQETAYKTLDAGLTALAPFFPAAGFTRPILAGIFGLASSGDGDAGTTVLNKKIDELRAELVKMIGETDRKIDENAKVILNAISTELIIGEYNATVNKMVNKAEELTRKISTTMDDVKAGRMTLNEAYVDTAMRIGRDNTWENGDNIIGLVNYVAKAFAGTSNLGLSSGKDLFSYAYDECTTKVMFSGEAYDMAEPYVDRIFQQFLYSYGTALQCLDAYEKVSRFTKAEINALSPAAKRDYDTLTASTSQVQTQLVRFTDLVFNADIENSVVTRYLQFKYKKEHDRNVFVRQGKEATPIASEFGEERMYADLEEDDDEYYYSDYCDMFDSDKSKIKSAVSSAAGKSAVSPDKINELYNYYRANYSDKSFDDFLDSMGISTTSIRGRSSTSFPLSSSTVEDKDKLAHYAKDEPDCPTDAFDVLTESAWSKYYSAGFSGFDHSAVNGGTKTFWDYKIKTWYVGKLVTRNYGMRYYHQDSIMLTFKKADRTNVPKTAWAISKLKDNPNGWVELVPKDPSKKYVVDTTNLYSRSWRYEPKNNLFYDFTVNYYDKNGELFKGAYVFEYQTQENSDMGIDLWTGGGVDFYEPGTFHVRLKIPLTGHPIYSNWVTVTVIADGDDTEQAEIIDDEPYVEADENTRLYIRNSYTGLVGAEPDDIEQPGEPLPEDYDAQTYEPEDEEYPQHQRLMVDAYDESTDRQIKVKYTWEAADAEGITLTEDGKVSFTQEGVYLVRVRSGEAVSSWFRVSAVETSGEYASVAFLDEDGTPLQVVTLPWGTEFAPPADPTKEGYTFAVWSQGIPSKMPADDMSIYATWTKNEPESSEPENSQPESKPAEKDTNPNTGAAIPAAAVMLCSVTAAMILAAKRKKR